MKLELFAEIIEELCLRYNVKLGKRYTKVYLEELECLTDEQFLKAFRWAACNCKFMPTPRELFDASGVSFDIDELWSQLIAGSVELNKYRYDLFKFNDEKRLLLDQLPDELMEFVHKNKLSIVELTNISDFDRSQIRESFKEFLKRKTPKEKSIKTNDPKLNAGRALQISSQK